MEVLKNIFKYFILYTIGALVYVGIELGFRGYSHWTMAILGGICFVILGGLNEFLPWDLAFWKQCIIGTIIITILEFITGCIVNLWLGWNVWDYSAIPLNLLGQVCLPFSIAWMFLSGVAIILDDWLRYWIFKEEKPHYKFN